MACVKCPAYVRPWVMWISLLSWWTRTALTRWTLRRGQHVCQGLSVEGELGPRCQEATLGSLSNVSQPNLLACLSFSNLGSSVRIIYRSHHEAASWYWAISGLSLFLFDFTSRVFCFLACFLVRNKGSSLKIWVCYNVFMEDVWFLFIQQVFYCTSSRSQAQIWGLGHSRGQETWWCLHRGQGFHGGLQITKNPVEGALNQEWLPEDTTSKLRSEMGDAGKGMQGWGWQSGRKGWNIRY